MFKKIGLFSVLLLSSASLLSDAKKAKRDAIEAKRALQRKAKSGIKTVKNAATQAAQTVTEKATVAVQTVKNTAAAATAPKVEVVEQTAAQALVTSLQTHMSRYEARAVTGTLATSNTLNNYRKYDFVVAPNSLVGLKSKALEERLSVLAINDDYYMVVIRPASIESAEAIIKYIKTLK